MRIFLANENPYIGDGKVYRQGFFNSFVRTESIRFVKRDLLNSCSESELLLLVLSCFGSFCLVLGQFVSHFESLWLILVFFGSTFV